MRFYVPLGSALVTMLAISGCASQPENITASYVSPTNYQSFSCNQIVAERNRVVNKVNELSSAQSRKANNDAVAMGVGAVLFWPALFALGAGTDLEPQIASLKGQYDALTQAGIQKNCFTG